jgi:hypothetical protein
MMDHLLRKGRGWRRVAQGAAALLAVAGSGVVGGCLNRPIGRNEPKTTSTIVEPFTQSAVDKIDLLLMIDNSRSMADKQQILADAVPDLVKGLVNPKCVDPNDVTRVAPTQPTDPLKDCETGFKREFDPVLDIHIGIITSSLGGHGADACPLMDPVCPTNLNPSNNDAGHLVTRKDACAPDQRVTTYEDKGFLAWDPNKKLMPPGETRIGDASMPGSGIVSTLRDMVLGTGQIGCGYEAQHESWYRFLIDPEPYKDLTIQADKAVPTGTDEKIVGDPMKMILGQRADFLRPSSLLAIIMLTDENDCSIKESGTSYLAAQQRALNDPSLEYHLPVPRAVCATDPNDPCCKSCGSDPGTCAADPTCGPPVKALTELEDDINLRCFDQKRRFGFDFLYPIDRYTNGLTQSKVPKRDGTLVPNPIFSDLNPNDNDSNIRNRGLVFIAGIVGVPWQLIARKNKDGNPDLVNGLNFEKKAIGGFKTFEELSVKEADGTSTWEKILGEPDKYVNPTDPHMIETFNVRSPLSTTAADPFNGHEYSIPEQDDLQYACIFDLLPSQKRDCTMNSVSCDCNTKAAADNPLCDPAKKTDQIKAKSYPGLRELALLKSVGPQGIVASVCPAQVDKADQPDYGYRPAIGAIINRLKTEIGGECLPRQLTPVVTETSQGPVAQVPCLILEARSTGGQCSCDASKARRDVTDAHQPAVKAAQDNSIAQATWDCFCEIAQTGDPANIQAGLSSLEELDACQQDPIVAPLVVGGPQDKQPANGWCYVDATTTPDTGNRALVDNCAANEKRKVRFVGAGNPFPNATLFITCSGGKADDL